MNKALTPDTLALLERVQIARKKNNLTLISIANEAGMAQSTVVNQFRGKFNLDLRVVLAVARMCPNVSAEYLLRGKGEVENSPKQEVLEQILRISQLLDNEAVMKLKSIGAH